MFEPIVIILTCVAMLWRSLKYFYVVDDQSVYRTMKDKEKPKSKLKRFWLHLIGYGYYDTKEEVYGKKNAENVEAHAIVMGLHTIVCLLIYFAFGRTPVSFAAALFFAVNPVNSEASVGLSAKHYSFATIACLIAWWVPFASIPIFAASQWLIVSLIPFPIMFLTLPGYFKLLALLCPVVAILKKSQVFSKQENIKMNAAIVNEEALSKHPRKLIIMLKFYGYNLANCILPRHMAFYHGYMSECFTDRKGVKDAYKPDAYFFIGLSALLFLILGLVFWYDGLYGVVWGLLWYTILILPWCNYVNLGQQLITSRYNYLANVGLMVTLANLVQNNPILWALAGWYAGSLFMTMGQYKNQFYDNTYQVFGEPDAPYSWVIHGNQNMSLGNHWAAATDYKQSINIYPTFKAWFNLSSAMLVQGLVKDAIYALEQAKLFDLLGQESTKDYEIGRREIQIGMVIEDAKTKPKVPRVLVTDVGVMI